MLPAEQLLLDLAHLVSYRLKYLIPTLQLGVADVLHAEIVQRRLVPVLVYRGQHGKHHLVGTVVCIFFIILGTYNDFDCIPIVLILLVLDAQHLRHLLIVYILYVRVFQELGSKIRDMPAIRELLDKLLP